MSHKKEKNKNQADDNRFDEVENLNPPEVPNDADQAKGIEPPLEDGSLAGKFPRVAKKQNGFMSMLEEANARRKARVKKYQNGKRDKEAGS